MEGDSLEEEDVQSSKCETMPVPRPLGNETNAVASDFEGVKRVVVRDKVSSCSVSNLLARACWRSRPFTDIAECSGW